MLVSMALVSDATFYCSFEILSKNFDSPFFRWFQIGSWFSCRKFGHTWRSSNTSCHCQSFNEWWFIISLIDCNKDIEVNLSWSLSISFPFLAMYGTWSVQIDYLSWVVVLGDGVKVTGYSTMATAAGESPAPSRTGWIACKNWVIWLLKLAIIFCWLLWKQWSKWGFEGRFLCCWVMHDYWK